MRETRIAIYPRYGSGEMKAIFEEESRLQKLLDVEAALARAHTAVGNIPRGDAKEISRKAGTEYVKLSRVKEIEAVIKHDLMAVVEALTEVCGPSGKYVHLGATSSDIIDTAQALQFKEATEIIRRNLVELEGILLDLAEKNVNVVAIEKTSTNHADPTTYGLKFLSWVEEVRRNIERLDEGKKRFLVGKMSGAVGTQASFGQKGMQIQDITMKELGLKGAMVSSQVIQRDRHAELMMVLALIAMMLDRMGREIRNFMHIEMSYEEDFSTVDKVCSLVSIIKSSVYVALENVSLEHERDLTNSSSERVVIPESFVLLDEILKSMKNVLKTIF